MATDASAAPEGTAAPGVPPAELRPLLAVLRSLRDGHFEARVPFDHASGLGLPAELAETVNQIAVRNEHLAAELQRVRTGLLRHGRMDERLSENPGHGAWGDCVHAVNALLDALLSTRADATRVLSAVADGDLSQRVQLHDGHRPLRGELRLLGRTVNRMTDQLALFTTEVTRAALEEDGEGGRRPRPGGRHTQHTTVHGLSGRWRDAAEAVNQIVSDLRETTRAKEWLESNITRLAALMQGRRDIRDVAELIMRELPPLVDAQFGAFFLAQGADTETPPAPEKLVYVAGYGNTAHQPGVSPVKGTPSHSGLLAQVASERRRLLLTDVPSGYLPIASGLGAASPACVVILPVLYEERVLGVVELASFSPFSDMHLAFFDQVAHTMGVALHTIRANTELSEKAALLAASSQYKTQFLANMSHELRTPLNSLLVLAQLLADNESGNLSTEEVSFARTIHRSGTDLLQLINDVLDLSKIEAGRMDVRPQRMPLLKLLNYVHDAFRPLALDRALGFSVTVAENTPHELHTDERRLHQILRNLLSNAFKFTAEGRVELHVSRMREDGEELTAFRVSDTGIGIAPHRLPRVFEAFQQGDSSTHRTYGGTGLGLSISKEIAGMLGGRISVESELGSGSVFTLYVPTGQAAGLSRTYELGTSRDHGQGHDQTQNQDQDQDHGQARARGQDRGQESRYFAVDPATAQALPVGTSTLSEDAWARKAVRAFRDRDPARAQGPGPAGGATPARVEPRAAARLTAAAPASAVTPLAPAAPAAGPGSGSDPAIDTGAETAAGQAASSLAAWHQGRAAEVLPGTRALLVDDDIRNVFALASVLGRVGVAVRYAENGREAIAQLEQGAPVDVVLMDIMMPELDGYEAVQALRADPRFVELPVIALTAQAMPGDSERSLSAGASAYVPKPVDVDRLLTAMLSLLDPQSPTRPQ